MRIWTKILGLSLGVAMLAGTACAIDFGTNITIWDGSDVGQTGPGYPTGSVGDEDQEVDFGAMWGQNFDLEGMFVDGSVLTIVGGTDFTDGDIEQGVKALTLHYGIGDLFIDTDQDAQIPADDPATGPPNTEMWGYDYVVDIDWDAGQYDVYQLVDGVSEVDPAHNAGHQEANPYLYLAGGVLVGEDIDLVLQTGGLTDADVGFLGDDEAGAGSHYAISFDLADCSALWAELDDLDQDGDLDSCNYFHMTLECGNDSANGHVPDGGTTVALMGLAIAGLGILVRRTA